MVPQEKSQLTILLHGFTGSAESWRGVEGHAIDLPGHGGFVPRRRSWDETLSALADTLPHDAHLKGYSLGARIAFGLLVLRPGQFTGATLISGSPGLAKESERALRREADEVWASMLEQEGIASFADAWEAQPVLQIRSPVSSEAIERARQIRRNHNPEALAWCLRTLGLGSMPNLWPALPQIKHPIRLITGAEDRKFCAIAEEMRAVLPNATLELVEGAGHNVVLERLTS